MLFKSRSLTPQKVLFGMIKLIVTFALIGYLTRNISFGQMRDMVFSIEIGWGSAAFVLLLVQIPMMTYRFAAVIAGTGRETRKRLVLRAIGAMVLFNQVLPSGLGGDGARIFILSKARLASIQHIIVTVMIDRAASLLGLVLLSGFMLYEFHNLTQGSKDPLAQAVMHIISITLVAAFLGWTIIFAFNRLPNWATSYPLGTRLEKVWGWLCTIFARPKTAGRVLGGAIAVHVLSCLSIWALLHGAGFSQVSWLSVTALVTPVLCAMNIPISIGGWGVRELGLVTALALIDIGPDAAFVTGVVFGFMQLGQGIFGGAVLLLIPQEKGIAGEELS